MRNIATLLATALLLAACNQQDPKSVAQRYWQALVDGDSEAAAKMATQASQPLFEQHVQALNAPDPLKQVAIDESRTIVVTVLNPDAGHPQADHPFNTVMVLEDGQWKVDLTQTRLPPPPTDVERRLKELSDTLSSSTEKNLESVEELVNEGMKLLDESLEQGSRDLGKTFREAMEKMQKQMRESIETMKKRREEMQQSPAGKDSGEGAI
jgi:Tfp pilus assembly protein PilW